MFILLLTYQKSLEEVDKHLSAHRLYLDANYSAGHFIASGPKNPRDGGVILCKTLTRSEVEELIKQDPFYINEVAQYSIVEFEPLKYAEGFEQYF